MKILPFKSSQAASIGIELEFQIINPHSMALVSRSKDLLRSVHDSPYQIYIKPEVTQSMIEINSSIHQSPRKMLEELLDIHNFLQLQGKELNILFCGGGTHPFQKWAMQKIFPTSRYKKFSRMYRFLTKRATVFGMHLHVGCKSPEESLYLTHALARYVPQLIAICASSPFIQGVDTGYYSSRFSAFNAFPFSGTIPYLVNWNEFSDFFYKMRNFDIIKTMKDVHWDIRPKPEFGTVEIRVCDSPLTITKAVAVAAYIQALSLYLLEEKPEALCHDIYYLYGYNRFQASRYGFEGNFLNPYDSSRCLIVDDILATIKKIERYANQLNNMGFISRVMEDVIKKHNDSVILRNLLKQTDSFTKVVAEQCRMWSEDKL